MAVQLWQLCQFGNWRPTSEFEAVDSGKSLFCQPASQPVSRRLLVSTKEAAFVGPHINCVWFGLVRPLRAGRPVALKSSRPIGLADEN